jgi:hypothetical protein
MGDLRPAPFPEPNNVFITVALSGFHSRNTRIIFSEDLLISSPGSVARAPSLVGPRRDYFLLTYSASLYLTAVAINVSAGVLCGVTNVFW